MRSLTINVTWPFEHGHVGRNRERAVIDAVLECVRQGRYPRTLLVAALAATVLFAGCSKRSNTMSVVDVFPVSGSTDVPRDAQIWAKFSTSVRLGSVSTRTFNTTGSDSGPAAGSFVLADNSRMVVFTPSRPFEAGETVTVKLRSGIKGKSGVSAKGRTFSFTTLPQAPPPPPPTITSRSPAPNSSGVDAGSDVVIDFDKTMNPFSFTAATVALVGDLSGRIPVEITGIMDTGIQLVLKPLREFMPFERITVMLGNGIAAADESGFPGETYSFLAANIAPVENLQRGDDVTSTGKIVAIVAADLDADGALDLVAHSEDGTVVQVFVSTGKGKFDTRAELPVDQLVLSIAIVDVDDDGRLDVLAGTLDRVVVFGNLTTEETGLAFQGGTDFATGAQVHSIVAGDVDHEAIGRPDILFDTGNGIHVHLAGLDGPPEEILGLTRITSTKLIMKDLDGDGHLDLAHGKFEGKSVSTRSFVPGEGFGEDTETSLPTDAREILVEDIEGDGKLEIIALVPSIIGGGEEIVLLSTTPDDTANPDPLSLATLSPSTMTVSDLDADGWLDILIGNPETATIRLLRNDNGALPGGMDEPQVLLNGEPIHAIVALDFTGDGVLDVIASSGDHLITLLSEMEAPPPPPPENDLALVAGASEPGDITRVDVLISNESSLDGYTVVVGFDPAILEAIDIETTGTATGALAPEFAAPVLDNASGVLSFNAIFEFFPPFDNRRLEPGTNQLLFRPVFRVLDGVPPGETALTLPTESLGVPPLATTLTSGGLAVPFDTVGTTMTILEPPPPPENGLAISVVEAEVGTTGVAVEVTLDNESTIEEFTVVVGFDPAAFAARDVAIDGTALGDLAPDVASVEIENVEGFLAFHVVADNVEPKGQKRLAPGDRRVLFWAIFDVLESAIEGPHPLTLPTVLNGSVPPHTVFFTDGEVVPFSTEGATFTVLPAPPPPGPSNTLGFEAVEARQGDSGVPVCVVLSNNRNIDTFTVFVGFDVGVFSVTDVSLSGTATEANDFEFRNVRFPSGGGFVGLDVIFDFQAPFEGQTLPPGSEQIIFKPILDVLQGAPVGDHSLRILETVDGEDTRLISGGERLDYEHIDGIFKVNEGPPPNNPNKLSLEDVTVPSGVVEFPDTVLLTTDEAIEAVTIIGTFDDRFIEVNDLNTVGTIISPLDPDFVVSKVETDFVPSFFSYAAIIDAFPPFSGNRILPGENLPVLHIIFSVADDTPEGEYDLRLQNELGTPPLANSFVRAGLNVFPSISGGKVIVRNAVKPKFIRGDTNNSGKVDLADHIYLVNFILQKGPRPPCLDAADVDDNGDIGMADMVAILDYLFKATFLPPVPFPAPGEDPTADALGCDVSTPLD